MGHVWMAQTISYLSPLGCSRGALDSTAPSAGGLGNPMEVIPGSTMGIAGKGPVGDDEERVHVNGLENDRV